LDLFFQYQGLSADLFRGLTSAPAIRVLSLGNTEPDGVSDAHIDAILENSTFSARIEYLRLDETTFGARSFLRIANECTALIGLEVSPKPVLNEAGNSLHPKPHVFSPVSKEEEEALNEAEMNETTTMMDAASTPVGVSGAELPLTLHSLLSSPSSFRSRLLALYLELPGSYHHSRNLNSIVTEVDSERQVCARFSRLAYARVGSYRLRLSEQVATLTPRVTGAQSQTPLSQFELMQITQQPLIGWLRTLKLHAGVPLLPCEVDPLSAHLRAYPQVNQAPDVEDFNGLPLSFRCRLLTRPR
jgi:hypothetical protein